MATGSRMRSVPLMAMAALGMPSKRALSGAWAMVRPPAARMALRPRAPSEPVPERTTAAPRSDQCSAIDSNR